MPNAVHSPLVFFTWFPYPQAIIPGDSKPRHLRIEMTSVSLFKAPTPPSSSFTPHTATDEELKANSYPPRPDPFEASDAHSAWTKVAIQKPEYIHSELVERPAGGLDENRNWAGAVVRATARGKPTFNESFTSAAGEWSVPVITPTKDPSGKIKSGSYSLWNWVGLDGWENGQALKVGTTAALEVDKDGKITSESYAAAILFRGREDKTITSYEFKDFPVSAGDRIFGIVSAEVGSPGPYTAWVFKFTSKGVKYAAGTVHGVEGIKHEGLTVEWVLAGRNPDSPKPLLFPHFSSDPYRYLFGLRENGKGVGAERGHLFDAEDLPIHVERLGTTSSLLFTNKKA